METIHTKVSCKVKTSFQHAWEELWRKAYNPQNFIPGIESLQLLEKTDDVIVRSIKIKGSTIKERITKDVENGTVRFHNIQGSDIHGNIFNHILQDPEQGKKDEIQLIFYSDAKNKNGEPFPPKEVFEKALLKTKEVMQATYQI